MKTKILIVTDNAAAQASLAETLNAHGYETLHTETADAFRTLAENPSHLIVVHDCFSNRSSQRSNPRRRTLEALTDLDPFIPVLLIVRPQDDLDYPSTLLADLVLTEPVATSALLEGIELLLSETLLERSQRKSGHIALFR
jgi:DNA-binding response OmpR family regulator